MEETQQKKNGNSILEPFRKLIWKFVISDTKSTTFIFALATLLFTLALVISSPVTNPFAFDSNWPFILCLLSIIIGRYYRTYITKVAALKSAVLTFTFVGVVIMIIHASLGVLDSFEVVSDYISISIF